MFVGPLATIALSAEKPRWLLLEYVRAGLQHTHTHTHRRAQEADDNSQSPGPAFAQHFHHGDDNVLHVSRMLTETDSSAVGGL